MKTEQANDNIPADEMLFAERIAYEATIADRNAEFEAMSTSEQRVTIAKDVLEWLRIGKLEATKGTYMEMYSRDTGLDCGLFTTDLQCMACALGAVFACAVTRSPGNFTGDRGNEGMRQALEPYFSESQLRLIEVAFEVWCFAEGEDDEMAVPGCGAAYMFGREFDNSTNRMAAIMRNIIANEGTFAP